jgi:serine protease Do
MFIMDCPGPRRSRLPLAMLLLWALVSVASRNAWAEAPREPIAAMVATVSPAVVLVVTVRPVASVADNSGDKAHASAAGELTSRSTGSGFIIDPGGYVATNKHVVDGAISVFVRTADGVRYPASIVGVTPAGADMALLRISADHPLPFVRFGDSDKMRPGDEVVAIGSPFGFTNSVSTGIISALNRDIMESPFDDYIQTDAAINHGNSGGPLFNVSGEVIGMTSVLYSPGGGNAGVGFAIPASSVQFVADRLIKTGAINAGMLPIHTQQVEWMLQQALDLPDQRGALVVSVQDPTDAMLRGKILPGDVIRTFNGRDVLDPRDLARQSARAPIGSDAVLVLCRGGVFQTVHVPIQRFPVEKPAALDNDGPKKLGLELASGHGDDGAPAVTVASVDPAGTAAASGIRQGDVIVAVQQTPVSEPNQALGILRTRSATDHHFAAILVSREKKLAWMSVAVPDPQ